MSACFETLATTFANPQADMCEEIVDKIDREAQAYKKRHTSAQSYAEIAQKWKTTQQATTQQKGTTEPLTVDKIQAVIASEIAKQLTITNANIGSKFDSLEKSVKDLDDKLDDQAADQDNQLQMLSDEQDAKMLQSFDKIANQFTAQQNELKAHLHNENTVLATNLNEYVNNLFASMSTQNARSLKEMEANTAKSFADFKSELFPRTRNRTDETGTPHSNQPQPAVTPGSASTDTTMSVDGQDE